jgi:hypothetical protein
LASGPSSGLTAFCTVNPWELALAGTIPNGSAASGGCSPRDQGLGYRCTLYPRNARAAFCTVNPWELALAGTIPNGSAASGGCSPRDQGLGYRCTLYPRNARAAFCTVNPWELALAGTIPNGSAASGGCSPRDQGLGYRCTLYPRNARSPPAPPLESVAMLPASCVARHLQPRFHRGGGGFRAWPLYMWAERDSGRAPGMTARFRPMTKATDTVQIQLPSLAIVLSKLFLERMYL